MARTLKCDAIQDPDGSTPNISLTDAVTSFGTLPVDINDGNIDGCTINTSDITVGFNKTLNVQAGTLTTSETQKNDILDGSSALALTNINTSTNYADVEVTGDLKVTGNNIKDSGGGNTITMDGSNNITVAGDVTTSKVKTSGDLALESTGTGALNFTSNSNLRTSIDTSGNLVTEGDVTAFGTASDENMKKDIANYREWAMGVIGKLNVKTFLYKDEYQNHAVRQGRQIGLIAQQVEQFLPEAVKTKEDGMKTIQYEVIVAILIQAVQEIFEQGIPNLHVTGFATEKKETE